LGNKTEKYVYGKVELITESRTSGCVQFSDLAVTRLVVSYFGFTCLIICFLYKFLCIY